MVELFPIKIYKSSIIPSKDEDKASEDILNDIFSKSTENFWTGESGFSTGEFSLSLHHHKEFNWLFEGLVSHLGNYWDQLSYGNIPVYLRDSWANLHYANHETEEHSHSDGLIGNSIISGVFYFRKPENESNIIFCNPLDYILRLQPYKDLKGIKTIGEEIETNQYDFLLFPSWLRHRVPAFKSNSKRIAISFNYARV